MLKTKSTSHFRRDYKLLERRGFAMQKLMHIVGLLAAETPLDPLHRDHPLKGEWHGYRGCHIADDWVLVYRVDKGRLLLTLTRTGTHADVYK